MRRCIRPGRGWRQSPIRSVIVTNADVDCVAGIVDACANDKASRCTPPPRTLGVLGANAIFNVLADDVVERRPIALNIPLRAAGADLEVVTAFALPGKVALWLEGE